MLEKTSKCTFKKQMILHKEQCQMLFAYTSLGYSIVFVFILHWINRDFFPQKRINRDFHFYIVVGPISMEIHVESRKYRS